MPELELANLENAFPLRFYMNLPYREDRRADLEMQFFHQNFAAERFPAINARWMKDRCVVIHQGTKPTTPVNQVSGLRAIAMTWRAILREAQRRNADRVLILQDNVVFHPELSAKLAELILPGDWGLFYLGCRRQAGEGSTLNRMPPAEPRLERVEDALDLQAVAIHQSQYRGVRRALRVCSQPGIVLPHPAEVLMQLQREIPTYAVVPNLAWQSAGYSNSQSKELALYDDQGNPLPAAAAVSDFREYGDARIAG